MAPGCWFFGALWLPLMLTVAAAEEQVEACSGSAKECGNLTISHPFWLSDRETGKSCGLPDFEVFCSDSSTPILLSSVAVSYGFEIIHIFYDEERLHVVDVGKLKLLHAPNSCSLPVWNTTVKLGLQFRIAPVSLNLVLYNCTEEAGAAALARRDAELVPTTRRCGNRSMVYAGAGGRYNGTSGYGGYEGCNAAVMPVRGSPAGKVNASDYGQLINDGFILTWELPPPRKFTSQIMSLIHFLPS
ncbi:uncharacterized protein [Aegilops tauschii subsp. strangulata]|uniref:uncharacterized protein n=1 Tax=Aegilops tauschii subsp. strangulata TaxID=200361 RepID=UPI001E1CA500|nr:uncharacterized protein LOC123497789 [Aegilops tauschii subsp. strangulata]